MAEPTNAKDDPREKLFLDIRQPKGSRAVFNIRHANGDLFATNIQRKTRADVPQPLNKSSDRRPELVYDIRLNDDGTINFNVRDGRGRLVYTTSKVDPTKSPEVVEVRDGVIRDKTIEEQLADQTRREADAITKADLLEAQKREASK